MRGGVGWCAKRARAATSRARAPLDVMSHGRRQDNRVAARGVDKQAAHGKLWLSAGDVFLRMSPADVRAAPARRMPLLHRPLLLGPCGVTRVGGACAE